MKKLIKKQEGGNGTSKKPISKSDSTLIANIKKGLADTTITGGKKFYPSLPSGALDSLINMYKRDNPGKPVYRKSGGSIKTKKK